MSEIDFPVVGIGASAGGLKALHEFFDHLPDDTGMAFVIIVHLAPQKTSAMEELISSHTTMKVRQIQGKTKLEPNHVYIIPPNKQLLLRDDQLLLEEKEKDTQAVIDVFFRSLAEACEKQAIGIVLSGTGSDGTLGLKAVKEYGGIMMVQEPAEATYSGMPLSAIDTHLVDFVLPARELARKVIEYKVNLGKVKVPLHEDKLAKREEIALNQIFELLGSKKNHDFAQYKRSSILRRLQRRLYVSNCKNIAKYREYLDKNPDEIERLYDDLLISVTRFFRDPEAFDQLKKKFIPKLFEGKDTDDPIRIWVVGCATGEEVYSLAILLCEYASTLDYTPQIKIFGTDISDEALSIARKGIYPEEISTDISDDRLQRYFHKEDGGYRIGKVIRNLVLISKHNILSDPPFVNQDLISCRNLLIYFNKNLQTEALKILHHSLNSEGYLFLGSSDSVIAAADYFKPVEKAYGIYRSRLIPQSQKEVPLPLLRNMGKLTISWPGKIPTKKEEGFEEIHHSLLAAQYAPPSVIVDENNYVMHSSKGIAPYLHYSEGEPSRDLLDMASIQLQCPLRNLIFQFNKLENPQPMTRRVNLEYPGSSLAVDLKISAIDKPGLAKGYRQIVFQKVDPQSSIPGAGEDIELQKYEGLEVVQLEKELEQTREQLQQIVEEYEASNEELMTSNEELQSMNEELQTITEELETSKEELQSVNEELKIVNEERESKIEDLQRANDDLKNLMDATEIGIIFLNLNMDIKRYTSSTNKLFNLIESDLGRPLSHITHHLQDIDLTKEVREILDDTGRGKKIVRSSDGGWYVLRIKPYKTMEHKVEGIVLTFLDITDLKVAEDLIRKRAENEGALVQLGIEYLEYEDPQQVLDRAAEMLRERLDFTNVALLRLEPDPNKLSLASGYGWGKEAEAALSTLASNSVFDYALETRSPVVVTDFDKEKRFKQPQWMRDHNIKSGITAGIYGSKNSFGLLGVYAQERRSYAEHEINFIQNTAFRVGEALERIQTERKLTETNHELQAKIKIQKQLQQDVLRVEKKERWSIGQFLHDEISQNLLAIKTLLDFSPQIKKLDKKSQNEIKDIKELIIKSIQNIRELSHFVLPLGEGITCAADALSLLVKQTENVYDVECSLKVDDSTGKITDNSITSSVYYIAQEAITNAIKHGKATKIEVELSSDEDMLYLTVKDNGIGYERKASQDGQGINIMKYRSELLGGSSEITRVSKEGGTLVKCILPLAKIKNDRFYAAPILPGSL